MDHSKYFEKRKTVQAPKFHFEDEYWGVVKDPDGKLRNLIDERDKRYKDYQAEIDFINELPKGRILDVGCGFGYSLSWVADGWEKHGTELSEYAAKVAAKYAKVFVGKLDEAKYPSNYFDVVTAFHVLEHVEDVVSLVREIYRILRDNGHFVIQMPNFDSACARRFGENYRMLHDETHINLISDYGLRLLLEDHFFKVDRIEYPYFETVHFTKENLMRLFDTSKTSPPFYGNLMSLYARKIGGGKTTAEEAVFELLRRKNCQERETITENLAGISTLSKMVAAQTEGNKPIYIVTEKEHVNLFDSLIKSFKASRVNVADFTGVGQTPLNSLVVAIGSDEALEDLEEVAKTHKSNVVILTVKNDKTESLRKNCSGMITVKSDNAFDFIQFAIHLLSNALQIAKKYENIFF